MKVFGHIMDEEGRHFFYLNEYQTKYLMIQCGQFGAKTLVSLTEVHPQGSFEIDMMLQDDESAVLLEINGSGRVTPHIEEWIRKKTDERYMIYGTFSADKLLNYIEEQIEDYIKDENLPENYYDDLLEVMDRYMRNPMNHRVQIQ